MHRDDHRATALSRSARLVPALLLLAIGLALPATAAEHDLTLDPAATDLTFFLEATGHDVEGQLFLQEGHLHYDTDTGDASGRFVLGAPNTETGNDKRDQKMHEKVLESTLYPEIVLVPHRISGPVDENGAGRFDLEGTLTLHGAEHEVVMPTEVEIDEEGRVVAHATLDVPYVEWGLKDPSILFLRVAKVVQVDIRFTAPLDRDAGGPDDDVVTARKGSR